jgi:hypothetical protein
MMKNVGLILVCCLYGIMVLTPMVHANPIEVTLTNISIYQDNHPIDESINLMVKCYGSFNEYRLKAMGLPDNRSIGSDPELVYSYSISCEPDNCYREDRYNPTWGILISSCDLEGIYKEKTFVVKNFTTNPEPACISTTGLSFGGYEKHGRKLEHYALNKEARVYCDTRHSDDIRDYCDKYLEPDRPDTQEARFIRETRNKTRFIATEEFVQCREPIDNQQRLCYETYSLANLSMMENSRAVHYCEIRFDIPTDANMSEYPVVPAAAPFVAKSLVESLFCSILEFLGGKCE